MDSSAQEVEVEKFQIQDQPKICSKTLSSKKEREEERKPKR